jgi:hypothetical protein
LEQGLVSWGRVWSLRTGSGLSGQGLDSQSRVWTLRAGSGLPEQGLDSQGRVWSLGAGSGLSGHENPADIIFLNVVYFILHVKGLKE